ncbi:MAG TPA: alpha/beta fold hydrolase, partial [Candidatus Limnocylindrales bacterium]|nr:alpha/beta fold hydrolase [Candidatus Limnocylindrales bacterium]
MSVRCFLGHGASGTAASMAPFVTGLRARGVDAVAIDLPRRKAEDAVPAFHAVVPSAADVAIGGHSYGGRVASLAAAEPGAPYAGLVLFSYPLHPPGSPERTDARISHWPSIRCPVLLLSG